MALGVKQPLLGSVNVLKPGHCFPEVSTNISWPDTQFKAEKLNKLECDTCKVIWKLLFILLNSGNKWDEEIAAPWFKLF